MASIQFAGGKCHGAGEAKAMMRHADKDERMTHEHSNTDIQKDLTSKNSDLHGLSYQQMCDEYDAAIRGYQERSQKALRKDTVTLYDAIITVPRDLPADREDDWFRDVEKAINDHYGKPVVLDIKIHRDEIHDYIDPSTKKTVSSRTHGHCFMIPDVDGRLNAKRFSSRANMTTLNREINSITIEKYQCQFLTGEKTVDRGFQTVEELKRASDKEELLRDTVRARQELDGLISERDELFRQADEYAKDAGEWEIEAAYQESQAKESRAKLKAIEQRVRILSDVEVDQQKYHSFMGKVVLQDTDYEALTRTAKVADKAIKHAEDIESKRDAILQEAQQQAAEILRQAKKDRDKALLDRDRAKKTLDRYTQDLEKLRAMAEAGIECLPDWKDIRGGVLATKLIGILEYRPKSLRCIQPGALILQVQKALDKAIEQIPDEHMPETLRELQMVTKKVQEPDLSIDRDDRDDRGR